MAASARETPVSDIMIRRVVTVPLHLPMEELEGLLLRLGISGAPVVDAEGQLLGVVSKTDLVWEHHAQAGATEQNGAAASSPASPDGEEGNAPRRRTVEDLMSATTVALQQTASIAHAAALMAHEGIHRLPIISATGRVVGQVSSLDVLRWLGHSAGFVLPPSDD
jgi:CBS domain-containing protein